jgi:hypothetical protein
MWKAVNEINLSPEIKYGFHYTVYMIFITAPWYYVKFFCTGFLSKQDQNVQNVDKISLKTLSKTPFTASSFMKLANAERHNAEIFRAEFHTHRFRNIEITGANSFTTFKKVRL